MFEPNEKKHDLGNIGKTSWLHYLGHLILHNDRHWPRTDTKKLAVAYDQSRIWWFQDLDKTDRMALRGIIIEQVLATDMKKHFAMVSRFQVSFWSWHISSKDGTGVLLFSFTRSAMVESKVLPTNLNHDGNGKTCIVINSGWSNIAVLPLLTCHGSHCIQNAVLPLCWSFGFHACRRTSFQRLLSHLSHSL